VIKTLESSHESFTGQNIGGGAKSSHIYGTRAARILSIGTCDMPRTIYGSAADLLGGLYSLRHHRLRFGEHLFGDVDFVASCVGMLLWRGSSDLSRVDVHP
jgi:hypothetical protein